MQPQKLEFHNLIKANIDAHGYHLTIVTGQKSPRFAYTIGLAKTLGFELAFAGGYCFSVKEVETIFYGLFSLLSRKERNDEAHIQLNGLGEFSLQLVHPSWVEKLLLGIIEYYGSDQVAVRQIIPDQKHFTVEIPRMDLDIELVKGWWKNESIESEPPIPPNSMVATTLQVLQGEPILEITRWEEDDWEMWPCAPDELNEADIRVVSFEVMLGIDSTIAPALEVEVGKGIWREHREGEWNNWG